MANMGYARNQLTVSDLRACLTALENEGLSNLNSSEFNYAKILANLAVYNTTTNYKDIIQK